MKIKQYKVSKGIATPVNPWPNAVPMFIGDKLYSPTDEFTRESAAHTYATNAQDGVYDADCFGEPEFQYRYYQGSMAFKSITKQSQANYKDFDDFEKFCKESGQIKETRQFLPFNPIPKMETNELPSPEKGVKTAIEMCKLDLEPAGSFRKSTLVVYGERCMELMQEYADQQPANNDYAVKVIEEIKRLQSINKKSAKAYSAFQSCIELLNKALR